MRNVIESLGNVIAAKLLHNQPASGRDEATLQEFIETTESQPDPPLDPLSDAEWLEMDPRFRRIVLMAAAVIITE